MLENLLVTLDRWPRTYQAVLVVLLGVAAFYLPRLKIDDSPERWLPADTRAAWKELDDHFNFGDTVAVGLEYLRPICDDDIGPIHRFRDQLAAIAGMREVYDASLVAEDIEGVPLSELINPVNAKRFGLYEGALWSPPRVDPITGKPTQTLLIACELVYPSESTELHAMRRHVIDGIYRIVDESKRDSAFADVRFHLAGGILLMDELETRARTAAVLFLPLSMVVGVVSLLIGFRSFRALVLTVLGGIAAMLIVMGYVAWSGGGLGALTISAPTSDLDHRHCYDRSLCQLRRRSAGRWQHTGGARPNGPLGGGAVSRRGDFNGGWVFDAHVQSAFAGAGARIRIIRGLAVGILLRVYHFAAAADSAGLRGIDTDAGADGMVVGLAGAAAAQDHADIAGTNGCLWVVGLAVVADIAGWFEGRRRSVFVLRAG